ncbi:unnamed protein product, partial [Prunus brigantina]
MLPPNINSANSFSTKESSDACSCTGDLRIAAASISLYISLIRSTADSASGLTSTGSVGFLNRGVGTVAVAAAAACAASAIDRARSLPFIRILSFMGEALGALGVLRVAAASSAMAVLMLRRGRRTSRLRRERSGGRDRGLRIGRRSHESRKKEEIS